MSSESDLDMESNDAASNDATNEVGQGKGTDAIAAKKGPRKTPFRFNLQRDLALVIEVEKLKPFMESGKTCTDLWKKVTIAFNENAGADIDHTRAKLRFNNLISDFNKEDSSNRIKSGTEEEVNEFKDKLANLSSLLNDKKALDKEEETVKAKKVDKEKAAAEEIRSAGVSTVKRKISEEFDTPQGKRTTEKGLMEQWKEKQEMDRDQRLAEIDFKRQMKELENNTKLEELSIRREELAVNKMRLEMDREKQAHDAQLEVQRFELEKLERLEQVKTQQALLSLLANLKNN